MSLIGCMSQILSFYKVPFYKNQEAEIRQKLAIASKCNRLRVTTLEYTLFL